ncbi:MAG: ATP-dependent sacrificial sulfur transferase LarE [Candidatus Eisenbacteria bacterium]|uniref:ATP-dependent sacrificial sulfur transferase LarE n=1 Tax=Eiseniibacteriota bacterium TaxID=2212470 RepID=A0A948RXM1_UNCEI|nr:ATP-dependent sacrificial sulfur transferase LarE [Candidatus Eisenbacteria bacterium]MBU1948436.1 ATP-dependent sacrificial sulfur transferase LarE [Candidatus Eisenbacteria bacterium]MBU2692913.1 ATP-dependent sacrificial sulfur transferase LarE [Candidatus Eisenbacteria bacterium]
MNRQLEEKLERLESHLASLGSAVVAYSGGVDSAFLAVAAHRALGARMIAVLGHSPSLAQKEWNDACKISERFGFPMEKVVTHELENPLYQSNTPDRCYHCKDELFQILKTWAAEKGFQTVLDGTNKDDLGDYRPGRRAGEKHGIRSPLIDCGWTKEEIRQVSLALGIPIWDKPASPCLASRFPTGEPIRLEALRWVEKAETALRSLGFLEQRVRVHGEMARIELSLGEMPRMLEPGIRAAVIQSLHEAGFRRIVLDLEGYRSSGEGWSKNAEELP